MGHSGVSSRGTGSKLRPLNRCWKKKRWKVLPFETLLGWKHFCFFSSFYSQHPRHSKGLVVEEEFKMCGIFLRMKCSNDFSLFEISVILRFSCFIHTFCRSHWSMRRKPKRWPMWYRSSATSVGLAHPLLRTSQHLRFGPLNRTCREEKVNEKGWGFSPYFKVQIVQKVLRL